jgi:hypothetical protein
MLIATGSYELTKFRANENVLVSAEHIDGYNPLVGLSTNHRARRVTGESVSNMAPGRNVALGATMKHCRALLQRLRHSLSENMRTEIRLAGIYEALQGILNEIDCGRINSMRSFSVAVQGVIRDMVEISPSSTIHIKTKFESELLYVETPEIECACFNEMCLDAAWVPVSIEVDLEVFLESAIPNLRDDMFQRWMWIEVGLVDSAGLDVDFVPRIRCEKLVPEHGDSAIRGLAGLAFKSKHARKEPTRWRKRLNYSSPNGVSWKFLHALREGLYSLKVFMRVDWPMLQRVQVMPGACETKLGILKPSSRDLYATRQVF